MLVLILGSIIPLDIEFEHKEAHGVWPEPHIIFETILAIQPQERVVVPHQSKTKKGEEETQHDWDWMTKLTSKYAYKNYELKIRFSDIIGNRYLQVVHIGKDGSWPDPVVFDDTNFSPIQIGKPNQFKHSPLKYLR